MVQSQPDCDDKLLAVRAEDCNSKTKRSKPGSPLDVEYKNAIYTTPDDNLSQNSINSPKNKSLAKSSSSRVDHDQEDSSDDNEDDEVNDLFKQIRKMSNRSSSRSSNNTSFKGNKEKAKSSNPFLEPFHRHSSVDMKGRKKILWHVKIFYSIQSCERFKSTRVRTSK